MVRARIAIQLGVLAALASTLSGCSDPRQNIDLVALLSVDESSGFYPYVAGGSDVTQVYCTDHVECLQSIETPYFRMTRFADSSDSLEFAQGSRSDVHVSDWIVIEFTDRATPHDREAIASGIDGLYRSDP